MDMGLIEKYPERKAVFELLKHKEGSVIFTVINSTGEDKLFHNSGAFTPDPVSVGLAVFCMLTGFEALPEIFPEVMRAVTEWVKGSERKQEIQAAIMCVLTEGRGNELH